MARIGYMPQETAVFARQTDQPLSVALLVDTSGSTAKDLKFETESAARFLRALLAEGNPEDRVALFEDSLKPGGKVPLLIRPEHCYVFVAGGIPGYSFGTSYFSTPPYGATAVMTRPVRDATLTKAGR